METKRAGTVVLGAGAMGCAAAYQLAKRGERVLLVEQFDLLHDRGSSHGKARITRHSYADPRYAELMIPAFAAWRELEADIGRNLYFKTGGVSFCPAGVDYVDQVARSLTAIGIPHRRMTGAELRKAIPAFEVPEDHDAVFEPDAGVLAAEATLGAELALARRYGGDRFEVIERLPIERIDLEADRPTLVAGETRIEADYLIVTAGAWVTKLFPEWSAGLKVTRQQVTYFTGNSESFRFGAFPVFVFKGREGEPSFYGLPPVFGESVKIARHCGPEFDPSTPERPFDDSYEEVIRHFLRWNLPGLAYDPIVKTEVCLYTEDPGENFRVGTVPGRPDVLIASPCSGHGFKFSPLVGKVLADIAATGETAVDISGWRVPSSSNP